MPQGPGYITGNAVLGYRGVVCMHGLQLHLESNGKMQITRMATPKVLREIATEFTGKVYARSRKGMEQALQDMQELVKRKTLDELGETHVVNATVGGAAADLAEMQNLPGAEED